MLFPKRKKRNKKHKCKNAGRSRLKKLSAGLLILPVLLSACGRGRPEERKEAAPEKERSETLRRESLPSEELITKETGIKKEKRSLMTSSKNNAGKFSELTVTRRTDGFKRQERYKSEAESRTSPASPETSVPTPEKHTEKPAETTEPPKNSSSESVPQKTTQKTPAETTAKKTTESVPESSRTASSQPAETRRPETTADTTAPAASETEPPKVSETVPEDTAPLPELIGNSGRFFLFSDYGGEDAAKRAADAWALAELADRDSPWFYSGGWACWTAEDAYGIPRAWTVHFHRSAE